jgi:integrase
MVLTVVAIKNAKPREKSYRLFDGGGLYLEVSPRGGRWWRLKYRFDGKEKRISLGVYPDITLKEARDRRDEARRQLATKIDPSVHRKAVADTRADGVANSFEIIAREWHQKHAVNWATSHSVRIIRRLERDVFPWLGRCRVDTITASDLLKVLQRIESRGALDTAHRVRQVCGQVFRYAIATQRAQNDSSAALRGALPPVSQTHFPTITDPKAIGALLCAIDGYQGTFIVKCALQLAPLLFVRPGELRQAEWPEIDFDAAMWTIPAEKMKMRRQHLVPLATQSLEILHELYPLTGAGRYVFPGARSSRRPLSNNALNAALRRLGYAKDELVAHSFRSMASTLLNEQGWHRDAIERQLAHLESNTVRRAYDRAEHIDERCRMMQAWANYLASLKEKAEVTAIRGTVS